MKTLRYFSQRDFSRCNPPCKIIDMDDKLMEMLDVARFHSGVAYIPTSGKRTLQHELDMDRDGSSSHVKGLAVDLLAETSSDRRKILSGLIKAGFTRIGIGKNFIHADIDPDKDQDVIWHYYNG
jgi:zinc D-Ala-D-Ala carboxypeptidase